jgi:hypothetical protein
MLPGCQLMFIARQRNLKEKPFPMIQGVKWASSDLFIPGHLLLLALEMTALK